MLAAYFIIIGFLVVISIVPFFAFFTIPLMYLTTLVFFPVYTYVKLTIRKWQKALVAMFVFSLIGYPLLPFIPSYLEHKYRCSQSEVGVFERISLGDWHGQQRYAEDGLIPWFQPNTKGHSYSWRTGKYEVFHNKDGSILRQWKKDGVEYKQYRDALRIESRIEKYNYTTKRTTQLVSSNDGEVILEMINYSRDSVFTIPMFSTGLGWCSEAFVVKKFAGSDPITTNVWKNEFDKLKSLYETPRSE